MARGSEVTGESQVNYTKMGDVTYEKMQKRRMKITQR
jgi:drug/metabolite transporter (DMT)-like permease